MKSRTSALALALWSLLLTAPPAHAWNGFGHRVIAAIAYNQLDPATRSRAVDLLRNHPAALDPTYWSAHQDNGPDLGLNLFMNASLFADDVRRDGPFHQYHIGRAHYINWRVRADLDGRIEEPLGDPDDADDLHRDVLISLATNAAIVRDTTRPEAGRAVALGWIFHQLGDLHQPLHTVARFTKDLPGGDRGGNEVRVPGGNLHGYWDGALGRDEAPAVVEAKAAELARAFRRRALAGELATPPDDFRAIGLEGVGLATAVVYRDLDPSFRQFAELPVGYAAEAEAVSRKRIALAGHRLADLLRSLLPDPSPDAEAAR